MIFEERKESDFQTTPEGEKAVAMFYSYKDDNKISSEGINEMYNNMG